MLALITRWVTELEMVTLVLLVWWSTCLTLLAPIRPTCLDPRKLLIVQCNSPNPVIILISLTVYRLVALVLPTSCRRKLTSLRYVQNLLTVVIGLVQNLRKLTSSGRLTPSFLIVPRTEGELHTSVAASPRSVWKVCPCLLLVPPSTPLSLLRKRCLKLGTQLLHPPLTSVTPPTRLSITCFRRVIDMVQVLVVIPPLTFLSTLITAEHRLRQVPRNGPTPPPKHRVICLLARSRLYPLRLPSTILELQHSNLRSPSTFDTTWLWVPLMCLWRTERKVGRTPCDLLRMCGPRVTRCL